MKLSSFFASILLIPAIAFAMPGGVGNSLQKGLVGHWPLTGASEKVDLNLVSNFTDPFAFTSFNYSAGTITATSTGPGWSGFQSTDSFPVVIGEKYRLTFDLTVSSGTASDLQFFIGDGAVGSSYVSPSRYNSIEGRNSVTFTATSNGTMRLSNQINEDMTFSMSNIQVRKIQTADATPYDNHGTIYGTTSATGPHGEADGAMSFDGNALSAGIYNDYISVLDNNLLDFNTEMTWSVWLKTADIYNTDNGDTGQGIFYKKATENYGVITPGYSIWNKVSQSYFMLTLGDGTNTEYKTWSYGTTLESYDNKWFLLSISLTADGTVKFYFNNELKYTQQFTTVDLTNGLNNSNNLIIGKGNHGTWDGEMSDFRIYNRALTAEEVTQLYNEGSKTTITQKPSLERGLVGHWALNEASEVWTALSGDAWQNSTAYGRTTGTNYFSQTGNTINITSTSGSWFGAGKMYATSEKGKYKIHIKANLLNGQLQPAFHLYKDGTRVTYTAAQVPTTTIFTSNHASGFNYGSKSTLGIYEATDVIDLTNAPDFDAIHVALLSYNGTASPYLEFQNTDIIVKQLVTADSTPYDNHGKINGAVLAAGPNGETNGAMSFDGSNTLSISNPIHQPNLEQEWSVSVWAKLSSTGGTTTQTLLSGLNRGLHLFYYTKSLLYLNSGDNDYYTYGTADLRDDQWHNFVFSFRNSDGYRKIFVDGIDDSSSGPNKTSTPLGISSNLTIGTTVTGDLSDLRIYNRVLTTQEITQLYEEKGKIIGNKLPSLETGLVGHWPLSGGYTNPTAFSDITPYDNHGAFTGTTLTTGINGEVEGATSFNGADDIINCGISSLFTFGTNDHTFTAWVNPVAFNNTYNYIISVGNNLSGQQSGFGINSGGNLFHSAYSSPLVVFSNASVATNSWQLVALVFSGGSSSVYVNGVFKETLSIAMNVQTGKCFIGSHTAGSSFFNNGSLSDVRIYNRALSADEVKRLYELR